MTMTKCNMETLRPPITELELTGTVASGLGEGTFFTQLDWLVEFFRCRLGFVPYPGTFNFKMQGAPWEQGRAQLLQTPGVEVSPTVGCCGAFCYPIKLTGGVSGVAIFPDVPGYPTDKLEVVASVNVRQTLAVIDGDELKIFIDVAGDTRRKI